MRRFLSSAARGFSRKKASPEPVRALSCALARLLTFIAALTACALHAETPGKDGDRTITSAQIVNEYAVLAGNAQVGATQITVVGRAANLPSLSVGDLVMLYQAQGASISSADARSYGAVTAMNSAGRYEFHTVRAITGNTITLHTFGTACNGLTFSYSASGKAQVVRVPQFRNLNVSGGGRIVARPWDGSRGGVIAMTVADRLTLSGRIDASGQGFRGGGVDNETRDTGDSYFGYRSTQPRDGAEKGEGIAGYRAELPGSAFYGRGAAANGGGGGNAHNAGGGGGANGNNGRNWRGQGVPDTSNPQWTAAWDLDPTLNANTSEAGGGRGGYTYSRVGDALVDAPGSTAWPNDRRRELGGLGGRPLDYDGSGRLFFGGGGGAGDGNNFAAGEGGNGGGLVFISAGQITGGGQILADGADGADTSPSHNDGPGGGGAGGTVIVQSGGSVGAQISASGGDGGNQLITNDENEGPGGGGSGGVIATSGGVSATFARGGANGVTSSSSLTEFPPNGATMGATGQPLVSAPSPGATPFCRMPETTIDLSKTSRPTALTGRSAFRTPLADQTYTIRFVNEGAAIDAGTLVLTDTIPQELELWTGAFDTSVSAPVGFQDGSGALATGLACCTSAQISFSNQATGGNFSYTPNGDYDPAVRRLRISPTGPVPEGWDAPREFTVTLRARVK